MIDAFSRWGLRFVMLGAVVLAITSTLGYGLAKDVFVWVLLRIMWGLSFSAMRLGTMAFAMQSQKQGLAFGISRSFQEAGPMISLLIAPLLLAYLEPPTIFYLLSALSFPALYFAWSLPVSDRRVLVKGSGALLRRPSTLNLITFISAFVIDGMLVVVLGVLLLANGDQITLIKATTLAALYLGYRRICLVVLSTAGGWVADNIGMERMFNMSMALVVFGLFLIISGWVGTGVVIAFSFYSINSAMTPGSASKSAYPLAGIAENATWRDVGAATGSLIGGFLISSQFLTGVLIIAVLIMVSLLAAHSGPVRKMLKAPYVWK